MARRADSVLNTLSSLGTASGDKARATRPDVRRTPLTIRELDALYRFNGYARRLVDIVPDNATRTGWTINDGTDNPNPMKEEDKRLYTFSTIGDADRWGRLYGGALVLMVTDDDLPAEFKDPDPVRAAGLARKWLAQPLDLERVIRVANLVVLDRTEFEVLDYESNPRSPRFREPNAYHISPNTRGSHTLGSMVIHASRTLYFRGARLPPTLRGSNLEMDDSVLESYWDAIRGKTSSDQAGEILTHEVKQDVLKIEGLSELEAGDQSRLFDARMKALALQKSLINMVLVGDGEDFQTHATPITGWADLDVRQETRLSAVSGVPQTKFFGQAPGGLNTDGGAQSDTFDQLIAGHQIAKYTIPLHWLYTVLYSAQEGPTNGQIPEVWDIDFNPLDEPSSQQQADLEKTIAETDAIRIADGIITPEQVAKSRHGEAGFNTTLLPVDLVAMEAEREARREAQRMAMEAQLAKAKNTEAAIAAATGGSAPDEPAPQGNGNAPREDRASTMNLARAQFADEAAVRAWAKGKGLILERITETPQGFTVVVAKAREDDFGVGTDDPDKAATAVLVDGAGKPEHDDGHLPEED